MIQEDLFMKDPSSYQVDILANPSAQVAKDEGKKTLDTSSRTLLKLLNKQDPLTAFSKMFMATFLSASTKFLAKWDHLITPQRHLLFQLRVSAPTKETDYGSSARTWPTPTTKGFGHASEGQTLIMRDLVERGELTEQEAQAMMDGTTLRPPRMKDWMWPTPTTQQTEHPKAKISKTNRRLSKDGKASYGLNLADSVLMWPTPRASIGMTMSLSENMAKKRHKRYLETEMAYQIHKDKLWATPNASLGKHSYNGNDAYYENRIAKGRQNDLAMEIYQKEGLGKLSPAFVEYLMGFPDGWTNPDISNEQLIKMNTETKD